MSLQIYCSKGCGVAITVTDEALAEASEYGIPMNVAHEVCPRDQEHYPEYRIKIEVYRHDFVEDLQTYEDDFEGTLLTTVGGKVRAATFAQAFDGITTQIAEQIENVSKMRHVIEDNI